MKSADHLKEYHRKIKSGEIERPKAKTPMEKALANPKSMRAAVNAMCWDCSGFSRPEVKRCEMEKCPLHNFRPWQSKDNAEDVGKDISALSHT